MDIETITKLLDAGYSKADIDAMQDDNKEGSQNGEKSGDETQASGKESSNAGEENASAIEQSVDINAAIENLTNTVATLSNTVKAMQDANIKGANGGKPEARSVDEVMQSFIESM